MGKLARVLAGRENWKNKAMARGKQVRQASRRLKSSLLKLEAERRRAKELEQENERL